jgi:outer membrane immunogenic protein
MISNTKEFLNNFNKSSPRLNLERGRDEDAIRDPNCGCCIQHHAGRGGRSRPVPAGGVYPPTPVVRVYNWTGCYLGAQLGGAFADNNINGVLAGFLFIQKDGATAATVGGQVGCDLQFARNWVVGAQIDGAWTNLVGSQALKGSSGTPSGGQVNLSGNLILANVIATATGRIGYAVNFDSIAGLFYLKGGAAFVDYDSSSFIGAFNTCTLFDSTKNTCTGASLTSAIAFNAPSANRFGWTIGVGTEWAVADNLSVFGEWDYMNFGTHNLTFTDPNFGSSQTSVKQQINVLKLAVNYRFGNSLPQQYP